MTDTTRPIGLRTDQGVARPLTRRRMAAGFSVLSTLTMLIVPIVGFLVPPRRSGAGTGGRLLAGTTDQLPPGTGTVVALGSQPVIVVNSADTGVKAFSAVCTHLGCIVGYDAAKSPNIISPCHDGHFSVADGRVLSGPPPAPLAEFQVSVEGDEIFVLG
jgi:Rieske Fe-S protein